MTGYTVPGHRINQTSISGAPMVRLLRPDGMTEDWVLGNPGDMPGVTEGMFVVRDPEDQFCYYVREQPAGLLEELRTLIDKYQGTPEHDLLSSVLNRLVLTDQPFRIIGVEFLVRVDADHEQLLDLLSDLRDDHGSLIAEMRLIDEHAPERRISGPDAEELFATEVSYPGKARK